MLMEMGKLGTSSLLERANRLKQNEIEGEPFFEGTPSHKNANSKDRWHHFTFHFIEVISL
jgi:heme oxygenase